MATATLVCAADPDVRQDLRAKLAWMIRARLEATAGAHVSKSDLQAFAARFPGVLRELDDAPLDALETRFHELDGDGPLPAWARPTWVYHAALREALAATRAGTRPAGGLVDHAIHATAEALGLDTRDVVRFALPFARRRQR